MSDDVKEEEEDGRRKKGRSQKKTEPKIAVRGLWGTEVDAEDMILSFPVALIATLFSNTYAKQTGSKFGSDAVSFFFSTR